MKTFNLNIIILLICTTFLNSSCTKDRVTANGNIITETRMPGEFTTIQSSGSSLVTISYGDEFKIELKGSSNLMPYYKTEVSAGALRVGYRNTNISKDDIKVHITLPLLKHLSLSGSGNAEIKNSFPPQEELNFNISGSANIKASSAFNVNHVLVSISGSGNADISKIISQIADIKISGSGDVKLNVINNLKARISGSGNIYYIGNPQTDIKISGSGKIIALN